MGKAMVSFTAFALALTAPTAAAASLRGNTQQQCVYYADAELTEPIYGDYAAADTISDCADSISSTGQCVCKGGKWQPHGESKPSTKCFNLYSEMAYNNLVQAFPGNPDAHAKGFATCRLCTNGTMTCDANVYGGKTELIASHIHLATNGNGTSGSGPPVINWCGTNGAGMINDGTPYGAACMPYSAGGNSLNPAMQGAQVAGTTGGEALALLVEDIGAHPGKYYLNFHSIASWSYWQMNSGDPVGMCRGEMQLSE